MICTSIQNKDFGQILDILQDPHVEMAEIRLDLCPLKDKEIEELFSDSDKPLVATCRIAELAKAMGAEKGGSPATALDSAVLAAGKAAGKDADRHIAAAEKEAERRLSIAIQAGARFADLEIEAGADFSKRFRALCHECGTEIIRSWHDFNGTPDFGYLKMISARCFRYGADIAKVVTTCRNADDASRILALYSGLNEPWPVSEMRNPRTGERPQIGEAVQNLDLLPKKRPQIGEAVQNLDLLHNGAAEVREMSQNRGHLSQNQPKMQEVSQVSGYLLQGGLPRLIAFGMGAEGRATRIECLKRGAPFSYACLNSEEATAPGQIPVDEMYRLLYEGAALPAATVIPTGSDTATVAPTGSHASTDSPKASGATPPGLPAPGGFFRNSLTVPASKSFAQRAILAAALAEGRSHLHRYTPCDDSESAIAVAKALGARIRRDGDTLTIDGIAASLSPAAGNIHTPAATKDDRSVATSQGPCEARGVRGVPDKTSIRPLHLSEVHAGESGLLTRLLIPLLAVLNEGSVTISGEKTLTSRPLKGVSDIMASFGVVVKENKVPITVTGNIIPGTAEISGKDGSQLISGLLAALPFCPKPSTLIITEPKSIPYMFITCDILKKFGIRISSEMEGDAAMIDEQDWSACTGITFKIKGGQRYLAADIDLEGDWSAAANFLVAGAIFGSAEIEGLNTDSIQADLAIADILVQAGAIVSELDDTICVRKAPLEGFEADLGNAPDLFPIVSVLAAFCQGESRIDGLGRLVSKESNRAEAILQMLAQMGVPAAADGDTLVVQGESLASRLLNGRLLKGGLYTSRGDHRMAMALKVASIGAAAPAGTTTNGTGSACHTGSASATVSSTGPIVIDDRECVSKSFPEFFESFDF